MIKWVFCILLIASSITLYSNPVFIDFDTKEVLKFTGANKAGKKVHTVLYKTGKKPKIYISLGNSTQLVFPYKIHKLNIPAMDILMTEPREPNTNYFSVKITEPKIPNGTSAGGHVVFDNGFNISFELVVVPPTQENSNVYILNEKTIKEQENKYSKYAFKELESKHKSIINRIYFVLTKLIFNESKKDIIMHNIEYKGTQLTLENIVRVSDYLLFNFTSTKRENISFTYDDVVLELTSFSRSGFVESKNEKKVFSPDNIIFYDNVGDSNKITVSFHVKNEIDQFYSTLRVGNNYIFNTKSDFLISKDKNVFKSDFSEL